MDGDVELAEARVGQTIGGRWRLDRVLGVGGMAAVYEARSADGALVALKLLHPEVAVRRDVRERFLREGYVANQLDHPGVVRALEHGDGGQEGVYLVMERLVGETLSARVKRHGRLPLEELVDYVDQILDVLVVAHEKGIVHRDLKPDNLFVTNEGKVKILDFGLARLLDELPGSHKTRTGLALGTLPYMAPEQALGRRSEIDGRVDLFALGATMFRILSGRKVHEAQSEAELLMAMASRPAPPLKSVAPDVPDGLAAVVDLALAFSRDARYPDARTMQLDVREVRAGNAPPYASQRFSAREEVTRADRAAPAIARPAEEPVPVSQRGTVPLAAYTPPPASVPRSAPQGVAAPPPSATSAAHPPRPSGATRPLAVTPPPGTVSPFAPQGATVPQAPTQAPFGSTLPPGSAQPLGLTPPPSTVSPFAQHAPAAPAGAPLPGTAVASPFASTLPPGSSAQAPSLAGAPPVYGQATQPPAPYGVASPVPVAAPTAARVAPHSKKPLMVALGALAALLVVAGAAGALWFSRSNTEELSADESPTTNASTAAAPALPTGVVRKAATNEASPAPASNTDPVRAAAPSDSKPTESRKLEFRDAGPENEGSAPPAASSASPSADSAETSTTTAFLPGSNGASSTPTVAGTATAAAAPATPKSAPPTVSLPKAKPTPPSPKKPKDKKSKN